MSNSGALEKLFESYLTKQEKIVANQETRQGRIEEELGALSRGVTKCTEAIVTLTVEAKADREAYSKAIDRIEENQISQGKKVSQLEQKTLENSKDNESLAKAFSAQDQNKKWTLTVILACFTLLSTLGFFATKGG